MPACSLCSGTPTLYMCIIMIHCTPTLGRALRNTLLIDAHKKARTCTYTCTTIILMLCFLMAKMVWKVFLPPPPNLQCTLLTIDFAYYNIVICMQIRKAWYGVAINAVISAFKARNGNLKVSFIAV